MNFIKQKNITVGIPVYNNKLSLLKSVYSILNQDIDDFKINILIVDDGSDKFTKEIIFKLASNHADIKVITHEKNLGRPSARNTIIKNLNSEYFAMLDADDVFYPYKLKSQFNFVKKKYDKFPENLILCGNLLEYDLDLEQIKVKNFSRHYENYDFKRLLSSDNIPISQLAVMKTDFVKELKFDNKLKRAQDWDFLISFFNKGGYADFCPGNPLSVFYFTRQNRNPLLIAQCMDYVVKKNYKLFKKHDVSIEETRKKYLKYVERFL